MTLELVNARGNFKLQIVEFWRFKKRNDILLPNILPRLNIVPETGCPVGAPHILA
jgi:hypothetical protein